jgi:exonuclease III
MRLLSWNVAGRTATLRGQAEAIRQCAPDLLALQEVTASTLGGWMPALPGAGLAHVQSSLHLPFTGTAAASPRPARGAVLLASRWPFRLLPVQAVSEDERLAPQVPWSECLLSAVVASPAGAIELHTIHVPPFTGKLAGVPIGMRKIETLEGLFAYLARPAVRPRILCGDFNAPKEERPDGTIIAFGGPRQRAAELAVLRGLSAWGLTDVYRALHGPAATARSYSHLVSGRFPRRFDHVFASIQTLRPRQCAYLLDWLQAGLSDHAPIMVDFELG